MNSFNEKKKDWMKSSAKSSAPPIVRSSKERFFLSVIENRFESWDAVNWIGMIVALEVLFVPLPGEVPQPCTQTIFGFPLASG